jgi:hypothetical protein
MRHMDNTLFSSIPPVMAMINIATTLGPSDANLFRFHTYEDCLRNPLRIRTYENVTQPFQSTRL